MSAVPVYLRLPVNAQALREARWSAGINQTILAVRAGVSLRTVVIAEAQGIASRKTIERLAVILRVPPHDLAPDLVPAPQPPPPPPISPAPEFRISQEATP